MSARFLADNLTISAVAAQNLIKRLEGVGILEPATGKYRKSALFQASDILDLPEHGAEAPTRSRRRS